MLYLSGMTYSTRSVRARCHIVLKLARDNGTYTEELDVVEDLVVERKVIAGNDLDTSILLDLPVLQTKSLSLLQKFITRDLVTPVSLGGLLEVTESSHAGETQNSAK